ncbi:MAG TPA: hypothetical protein VID93_05595, partial [Acidimicrobiales bacterium]
MSDEVGPGAAAPSWRDITIQPYRRRRDWRWWVGLVGLLLLAFVGYQLWGTGIQTRQAQNRLEQQFTAALPPTTTTTTAPPTTAPSSTDVPATSTTVAPTTTTLPP